MAQRRHHYERAFEEYLRTRRIPYVAVDEARKALLPDNAPLRMNYAEPVQVATEDGGVTHEESVALKSFDFVIYGWDWTGKGQGDSNLLLDVKGRRVVAARRRVPVGVESGTAGAASDGPEFDDHDDDPARQALARQAKARKGAAATPPPGAGVGRLESWVTQDDVQSLDRWGSLFGAGFDPAFVFVYWCDDQPPDALFQEVFEFQGRWYALRVVRLREYTQAMKPRSLRWRTVHVPTAAFERISRPFARRPLTGRE